MIEVKNLTKRYGQNLALDRVSFKIEEGTIVGFLGPVNPPQCTSSRATFPPPPAR